MTTKLKINDLTEVKSMNSQELSAVRGGMASERTLFSHPMSGNSGSGRSSSIFNQYLFDIDYTVVESLNVYEGDYYNQDIVQNTLNAVDITAVESMVGVNVNQAQNGSTDMG